MKEIWKEKQDNQKEICQCYYLRDQVFYLQACYGKLDLHLGFPANENFREKIWKLAFVFRKLFREISRFFAKTKAAKINCEKKHVDKLICFIISWSIFSFPHFFCRKIFAFFPPEMFAFIFFAKFSRFFAKFYFHWIFFIRSVNFFCFCFTVYTKWKWSQLK